MATNFPTTLDTFTNPLPTSLLLSPSHSLQHSDANDAIEALEAKVGITNSNVTTSLDYLVRNINATTAVVSGNVGIGTAAPVAKLEVLGSNTVSSQTNVSGVFGATTSGRLLLGSITGNTPFIGSEGATTLAFTTNSTVQMRIDPAGDVRIGTTNNYGKLNVAGSAAIHHATPLLNLVNASNTRLGYLYHDATNLQLLNHSASGGIQLATNSVNRLNINSAGEVGIASSPTTGIRLTVTGDTTNSVNPTLILNGVSGSGALYFHNDISGGSYNGIVTAGSRAIIATGPNGTTSKAALVIAPWSDTAYGIRFTGGATTDILVRGTTTFTSSLAADKALIVKGVASQAGDFIDVQDSSGASKFKVDSLGEVGIGTASPEYLFDISAGALGGTAGDEIIASRVGSTNANIDQILTKFRRIATGSTFVTAQAKIQRRTDGSDQGYVGFGGGSDASVRLGSNVTDIAQFHPTFVSLEPSSYVAISTASAERMRIDSAGNFLVGTSTRRSVGGSYQNAIPSQIFTEQGSTGLTAYTSVVNRANSDGLRFILGRSRGTAAGAVTALVSNDSIAELMFAGADGTTLDPLAARIMVHVDGAVAQGSVPGRLSFATNPLAGTNPIERMRIDSAGNVGIGITAPTSKLHVVGSFSRGAPVTKTSNFTLADTENWIICNGTTSIAVTLPAASSQVGREITIKNIAAFTVVSASINIVPINSGTAGTAILPATAGSWVTLVSNGTNWVIMQS